MNPKFLFIRIMVCFCYGFIIVPVFAQTPPVARVMRSEELIRNVQERDNAVSTVRRFRFEHIKIEGVTLTAEQTKRLGEIVDINKNIFLTLAEVDVLVGDVRAYLAREGVSTIGVEVGIEKGVFIIRKKM